MAVVQLGRGSVPKPVPAVAVDVIGGVIIDYVGSGIAGGVVSGYALSGGSTHVGGFWPMQAGSTAITTDGAGQASITFPYAFANTPTAVVATVDGSDYAARIVSKSTTGFTVKILQGGVNWTSGTAVTSVSAPTASFFMYTNSWDSVYAATTSGGPSTKNVYAADTGGATTTAAVTSVSTGTSNFAVSVSGFLTAAASVSVTVDWIGAA